MAEKKEQESMCFAKRESGGVGRWREREKREGEEERE